MLWKGGKKFKYIGGYGWNLGEVHESPWGVRVRQDQDSRGGVAFLK